jgi:hypothetical protein
MTASCHYPFRCRAALLVGGLLLAALVLLPRPLRAEPYQVNYLFPAGAAQGATLTITLGQTPRWPVRVWSDSGQVTAAAMDEKGKLQISVAADAHPGRQWLRIYDEQGSSGLLPFLVGILPELEETEPNDRVHEAQVLTTSSTVNGRLAKAGDVDGFAISLQSGQTLVASCAAHAGLGTSMDAVMQICLVRGASAATSENAVDPAGIPEDAEAFIVAQNDDEVGIDPQLVFTAPANGQYLVRLFAFPETPTSSISFAGGEAMVYRLSVTTGGFVDHARMLAVQAQQPAALELIGWNLEQTSLPVTAPASAEHGVAGEWPVGVAGHSGALSLVVQPHTCIVETEPNDQQQPQAITVPTTISGSIQQPGDLDAFRFSASKGQRLLIRVESGALGFALDGVLQIWNAENKAIATQDDQGSENDPRLVWTAPADGEYLLTVVDRFLHGGKRFAYRLTIQPEPEFALKVDPGAWELSGDKPQTMDVAVERRDGFDGEIAITVIDLPQGVVCDAVTSAKGGTAKKVTLTLRKAENWQGVIRIQGRAGETAQTATASPAPSGSPRRLLWLTVRM